MFVVKILQTRQIQTLVLFLNVLKHQLFCSCDNNLTRVIFQKLSLLAPLLSSSKSQSKTRKKNLKLEKFRTQK